MEIGAGSVKMPKEEVRNHDTQSTQRKHLPLAMASCQEDVSMVTDPPVGLYGEEGNRDLVEERMPLVENQGKEDVAIEAEEEEEDGEEEEEEEEGSIEIRSKE